MIVDLPEDAQEIFVGDPKIANAIVRSARRVYIIDARKPGRPRIFALGRDGRKIAVFEVTVGRDVGELTQLLKAAIPSNDIHVRTVGGSIILTGLRRLGRRRAAGARHRPGLRRRRAASRRSPTGGRRPQADRQTPPARSSTR